MMKPLDAGQSRMAMDDTHVSNITGHNFG